MLAQTEHIDIPHNDHFVVIFSKDGIVDCVDQSLLVAFRHPQERFGVPFWGTLETLSVWILTDTFEHSADGGT